MHKEQGQTDDGLGPGTVSSALGGLGPLETPVRRRRLSWASWPLACLIRTSE